MSQSFTPENIPALPDIPYAYLATASQIVALGPDIAHVVHRPRVLSLHLLVAQSDGGRIAHEDVLSALEQQAAPYTLDDESQVLAKRRIDAWLPALIGGPKPYFQGESSLTHTDDGKGILPLVGLHALRTLRDPEQQDLLFPAARRRPFAYGTRLVYLEGVLAGMRERDIAERAAVPQSMIAQHRKRLEAEHIIHHVPMLGPHNNFRVSPIWDGPVRTMLQQHHAVAANADYASKLAQLAVDVARDPDLVRPLAIRGLMDFLDKPRASDS